LSLALSVKLNHSWRDPGNLEQVFTEGWFSTLEYDLSASYGYHLTNACSIH